LPNSVENMSQQITGRFKTPSRGRYKRLSNTDENVSRQQIPSVPQLHEPIQREPILTNEDIEFRYFSTRTNTIGTEISRRNKRRSYKSRYITTTKQK